MALHHHFAASSTSQYTIIIPHYYSSLQRVAAKGPQALQCSNSCFWRTTWKSFATKYI